MSTPTVLPADALAQLVAVRPPADRRFAGRALARAGLYLTPVPLLAAASQSLAGLPTALPVAALATGWCAVSGLGYLGRLTATRAGPVPAARLVLASFAVVVLGFAGALALTPALAGPDPGRALAVSLPLLGFAAATAVAVATGAEPLLLRWCLPALLVAAASYGWLPELAGPLLAAAVALPVARVTLLAVRATPRPRRAPVPQPSPGTTARPAARELRRSGQQLLLGGAQALLVATVWQAGQAVGGLPLAILPLLLSVPAIELWAGWHLARVAAGLAGYDDRAAHHHYVRRVAWASLGWLLPPLVAAAGLAAAARRLPYGLSAHPDPPGQLLALATGLLLVGVMALSWLFAARDRPGLAALLTGAPALVAVAAEALRPTSPGVLGIAGAAWQATGWQDPLPVVAGAQAAAYAAGLVLAALLLLDPRTAGPGPASRRPAGRLAAGGWRPARSRR